MSSKSVLIRQTMDAIADAKSHFDASVHGDVVYSPEPVTSRSADAFWDEWSTKNLWCDTDKREHSRYGDDPKFSPEWLDHLSERDHRRIAIFVENHHKSFWAIDGLFSALVKQCVNSSPRYSHLLRNFLLLWDETTSHVLRSKTEDCYSLNVIAGLTDLDIGSLTLDDQGRYAALAAFSVESYLAGFDGRDGKPNAVWEIIFPGYYVVQEPYRSMVWENPHAVRFMIDYLTNGYAVGDEVHLAQLLEERTPAPLLAGLI